MSTKQTEYNQKLMIKGLCRRCYKAKESNRITKIHCNACAAVIKAKSKPEQIRKNNLKRNFGITPIQYDDMWNLQQGLCAICHKAPDSCRLSVDHCHVTGKIRGLLCRRCNGALGCLGDDTDLFKAAITYLDLSRQ